MQLRIIQEENYRYIRAGKTVWYVDSEGVISLKIDDKEYGKGQKEDKPAGEIDENEIVASDNPMLQSWGYNSKNDFHSDEYRSKITKIKFSSADKVPENKVEMWDVSEAKDKSVMAWVEDDGNNGYVLTIAGKEKIVANTNSFALFYNFNKVTEIENINLLDTSLVSNFVSMFCNCSNISELDLSSFDTSNAVTIASMFQGCNNLTNLNLSSFNTGKVKSFEALFRGCSSLNQVDLSNFDTSNGTQMNQMFYDCGSLIQLDLSNFNTSKVTNMISMFCNCNNLKILSLGQNFDIINVTDFSSMFKNCKNLITTLNLRRKNSGSYTYMYMFLNAATEPSAKIKLTYETNIEEAFVNTLIEMFPDSNLIKEIRT